MIKQVNGKYCIGLVNTINNISMKLIVKQISISDLVFVCFWILGNSISESLHDYGFFFYSFALLSISFLVGYSSISILEIIKNKFIRIFIGLIIYAILLFIYISLNGKFTKWGLLIIIIAIQIFLFYLCLMIIKYFFSKKTD